MNHNFLKDPSDQKQLQTKLRSLIEDEKWALIALWILKKVKSMASINI